MSPGRLGHSEQKKEDQQQARNSRGKKRTPPAEMLRYLSASKKSNQQTDIETRGVDGKRRAALPWRIKCRDYRLDRRSGSGFPDTREDASKDELERAGSIGADDRHPTEEC